MTAPDNALVDRWRNSGDADAFQELVVRHAAMVYGTCLRIVRSPADAEDVTQECFLELARVPGRIRETVGGWLHGVATRKSLARARADTRRQRRENAYAAQQPTQSVPQWDDIRPHIDEAVADLPSELRDVIVLRFFEGQKHGDIGARLGVAEATVRYRIQKALERLRKTLAKKGVSASAATLGGLLATHSAEAALPAQLTVSLGRNLLAQAAAGTPGVAAPTLVAGALIMKKTAVVIVLLAAALGALFLAKRPVESPSETKIEDAVQTAAAVPSTGADMATAKVNTSSDAEPQKQAAVVESEKVSGDSDSAPSADPESEAVHDTQTAGRISGQVIHIRTREPVPDYHMRVQRYMGVSPYGGFKFLCRVTTDADGRFSIDAPETTYYWFLPENETLAIAGRTSGSVKLTEPGEVRDDVVIEVGEGGTVEGRVYDQETGKGLADVQVIWAGNRLNVTTDAQGRYQVVGLEPGRHELGLGNTGEYINDAIGGMSARPIEINLGETITLDFPLSKGVVARGLVLDTDRRPIENAMIRLMPRQYTGEGNRTYAYGVTDADGRFILSGQPAGVGLDLNIFPPREPLSVRGYLFYGEEVNLADWRGERVFTLQEACDIQGHVVDAKTGQPITQFDAASFQGERQLDVQLLNAFDSHDDDQGVFHIANIQSGQTTLFVRAEGYATARKLINVETVGQAIELEFAMTGSCLIEGFVVDVAGNSIADGGVFVGDLPTGYQASDKYAPVKVDENGRFQIDTLGPGTHLLHAVKDGFLPSTREVTVEEGQSVHVEFVLGEGGVLSGMVTLDGEPIEGAQIYMRTDDGSHYASSETDGSYRIGALHSCVADVRAYLDVGGQRMSRRQSAEIVDDMETVVDFAFASPSAAIEGTVLVEGAAPSGQVQVVATDHAGMEITGDVVGGQFRVDDVPVGPVDIRVTFLDGPLQGRSLGRLITTMHDTVTRCDFRIDPSQGATLRGKVQGFNPGRTHYFVAEGHADFASLDELETMFAEGLLEAKLVAYEQPIAPDGSFELPGLAPGVYTILVVGPYPDGTEGHILRQFEVGEDDVTFDLRAE